MSAAAPDEQKLRAASHAAFLARADVQDARDHAEAFAWKRDLKFDIAGMNAMLGELNLAIPQNPTKTG